MKRVAMLLVPLAIVLASPAGAAEGVRLRIGGGVYGDTQGAALRNPEGLTLAAGRLVVADTGNGRLVQFAVGAETIDALAEWTIPELPYPIRVAGAASGDLFVLDGKLRRIGRVSSAGRFEGFVELPARDVPAVPRSLRVDRSGKLWVLDIAGARVIALDGSGKLDRDILLPAESRTACYADLAIDNHGSVFVLDSVGRQVLVARAGDQTFEPFGPSLREDLDFATSMALDETGRVFLADQNGGGVVILGTDGSFRGRQSALGWKEGLLRYPSALVADSGRLFVADRGNSRIEVFTIVQ